MKCRYLLIFLILTCYCRTCPAQDRVIDSLSKVLKTQNEDTNKVNALNTLAYSFHNINPDTTILLAHQALALAEKLDWVDGKITAYNYLGVGLYIKGDYSRALDYFLKAMQMMPLSGNKQVMSSIAGNIGNIYENQGDYPKALDYFLKTLSINEELGNSTNPKVALIGKKLQALVLGNIGNVYKNEGDYTKALDFYFKGLKIKEELGIIQGQGNSLANIGSIYEGQGNYAEALDYYMRGLKLAREAGNKESEAGILSNIGLAFTDHADSLTGKNAFARQDSLYNKALEYELNALKIFKEMGDKQGEAFNLGSIGSLYSKTRKFKEAEFYLLSAIRLDSNIGTLNDLGLCEGLISELYDTIGRYKPALVWYKRAMVVKDTMFNIDKNKALTRKEMTYEFEKKEAAEKAQQEIKDAKQRTVIRSVAGGLILVLIFAAFIFRSLRITRRQKQLIEIKNRETEEQKKIVEMQKTEVERQKQLVEEKNKDILDSITYAKRLQDAILPPLSLVKQYLPESFLLYKPKDIVAGDFYWMERAGDNILVAAADCTGHGVPGALVSVVCSNALNRTVKEFHITEPGKILDKVRELVLETFEKSEGNIQDGMDISLCCINTDTKEAQWSGAYNSLWYFRNGEVTEVPADKQPIGKTDKPEPFNTHNLNLQKGDTLYLFTDGYADQFGGPKGKKFKYKPMQELLLANAGKSMDEQKKILEDALNEWKGSLEQVDDVLVIGIRV